MSLSVKLKMTRQKALLTQEDFALELGVSVATINRWENGHSTPGMAAMKNLKNFCEKNNISFSDIENEWLNNSMEDKK